MTLDSDDNLRRVRINREYAVIYCHSIIRIGISIDSRRNGVLAHIRTFFTSQCHVLQGVFDFIEREESFGRIGEFRIFFAEGLGGVRNRQDNRLRNDFELSVFDSKRDVRIVDGGVCKIAIGKSHGVNFRIGASYSGIAIIGDEIHRIGFHAGYHVETAYRMFLAVINHSI